MDNTMRVGDIESHGDLCENLTRALETESSIEEDLFLKGSAFQPFHRYIRQAVASSTGIHDVRDIVMRKMPCHLRFSFEELEHAFVTDGDVRLQDFDRYVAIDAKVVRAIDRAHSTDTNQGFQPVFFNESTTYQVVGITQREQRAIFKAEALGDWILTLACGAEFHRAASFQV
jgi:hypothetical protein